MTEFICITFGPNEYNAQWDAKKSWWNDKEYFTSKRQAEKHGLDKLSIAGVFGYVVIEEGEDYWEVVDELGAPESAVTISCKWIGAQSIYSVQPSPALVIV
tara:strand:- start:1083 stop:1385 length:303 start_codon:yes stop_codon:yes gene_type:complete